MDGLVPGLEYDVSIWSYDADNYSVFTVDWYVNNELVRSGFLSDGSSDPTFNAQQRIDLLATADALGQLLIEGRNSSTGDYRINALQIHAFVPEPGALTLLALGAAILVCCRRRRE